MNNQHYCVIMAGGIGSRFWPLSKTKKPKQFLDILGTGSTLLQHTFNRLSKIFPIENIYVVTNDDYKDLVYDQVPEINDSDEKVEPYTFSIKIPKSEKSLDLEIIEELIDAHKPAHTSYKLEVGSK